VEEIVSLNFVDLVEGLALDPVGDRLYVAFNSQAISQTRSYGLDGQI